MRVEDFQNYCLRIDLLDVDFECYWVMRVPDWLTLFEFHQCFQVVLDWSEEVPYDFDFEDASYEESRFRGKDTRRTFLSDAFLDCESAYYHLHRESTWNFLVRRIMVCSDVSSAVTLLHGEEFPPPSGCLRVEDYVERYWAGDLTRKVPAEETERRLQRLERNTTNWIGPYRSRGMTLYQSVVATLLERGNRPAFPEEIEARLFWSDYERNIEPASIRRACKRGAVERDEQGRLYLDKESPHYHHALNDLAGFRDPTNGVKLLVKRFSTHLLTVEGESPDIILAVDSEKEQVQGMELCHERDGLEPYLDAIEVARTKLPGIHAVVVDEDDLDLELAKKVDLPVELRFSLEELNEPLLSLKHPAIEDSECVYPPELSRADLEAFCEASQRYLLAAPWIYVSEPEVFCIEGLRPEPLYAVVLGYAYELYGLSLFQDFSEVLRLLRGERPCHPFCFMDFPNTLDSKKLRQTLDREQIDYLSRDTCPFVYGNRAPAQPAHFRLVTRVLHLIAKRVSPLAGATPGSVKMEDAGGHEIVVTWPVDLSQAL